jgi:hypothetical protein
MAFPIDSAQAWSGLVHVAIVNRMVRTLSSDDLALFLNRSFFLFERPVFNLCNNVWSSAINDEARRRKLGVLLTGQMGNLSAAILSSCSWAHALRGYRDCEVVAHPQATKVARRRSRQSG